MGFPVFDVGEPMSFLIGPTYYPLNTKANPILWKNYLSKSDANNRCNINKH